MTNTQVWRLTVDGRAHRVEADPGTSRRLRWYVDDDLVAEKKSMDEKVRLECAGRPARRPLLHARARRGGRPSSTAPTAATWSPDPGSAGGAATRTRCGRTRDRYATIQTVGGVGQVVVPIVLATVLARFALLAAVAGLGRSRSPHSRRPDLPCAPAARPATARLDAAGLGRSRSSTHAHYVWPVVLAFVLARAEIRRRRRQDEKRGDRPSDPPTLHQ